MWTNSIVYNFWAIFFVYFNTSQSNLLQILLGWIRIRIEKNSWLRIRKKWMRIRSPASIWQNVVDLFSEKKGDYISIADPDPYQERIQQ